MFVFCGLIDCTGELCLEAAVTQVCGFTSVTNWVSDLAHAYACVCVCVCVGVRLNIFIHSQMMLVVKNLPAKERQIQSLGQEDPLEKEMATHSSIFTCKIPWTAEPGGLQSMGSQRVVHTRSD